MSTDISTIVVGSLNTDLVATGLRRFPNKGEHVYGKELIIGPGGKSRNIADMIAHLSGKNRVAMVGRTTEDPYGLWKVPIDALRHSGVDVQHINIVDFTESKKLPGIALIPVDRDGNNQIIVLPGVSDDFSTEDIDNASSLFEDVGSNDGSLVVTLECPLATAEHAINTAINAGLRVLFDPGGIEEGVNVDSILKSGVFLIKPNEHEAKILTGIEVVDHDTAKKAADELLGYGVHNILITLGADGAYLFSKEHDLHIPIPEIRASDQQDETGCGDQTIAALCAFIEEGKPLEEAARLAILAGTHQFNRVGIKPLTKEDLANG